MATFARREGDSLLVDGVDLKRASRKYLSILKEPGWSPPKDLNAAMELVSRILGYPNLHAANQQTLHASLKALSFGEQMPEPASPLDNMYERPWRDFAPALFRQALSNRRTDRVEIIALVGDTLTGKTILAKHMAKELDGVVLDMLEDIDGKAYEAIQHLPNQLIIFDAPADPGSRMRPALTTLFEVMTRRRQDRNRTYVFTFKNVAAVQGVLDSITHGTGEPMVDSAQVLDVETLQLQVFTSRYAQTTA